MFCSFLGAKGLIVHFDCSSFAAFLMHHVLQAFVLLRVWKFFPLSKIDFAIFKSIHLEKYCPSKIGFHGFFFRARKFWHVFFSEHEGKVSFVFNTVKTSENKIITTTITVKGDRSFIKRKTNHYPFSLTNRLILLNHFKPKIGIHIFHTVLYTFSMILTRRICLTIRSFLKWSSFLIFGWTLHLIQGGCCPRKEKVEARHFCGLKG